MSIAPRTPSSPTRANSFATRGSRALVTSLAFFSFAAAPAFAQTFPGEVEGVVSTSAISDALPVSLGDGFGLAVESLGDLDGDGVIDLAVGAPNDDDGVPFSGAVYVLFLNADRSVKSYQKISNTQGGLSSTLDSGDWFGSSLARLGDLDGDGVTELAVGAPGNDDVEDDSGATYVLLLNSDGTVKSERKISNMSGGFGYQLREDDAFGTSATGLGDLDGDGVPDMAAGSYMRDSDSPNDTGSVFILFLTATGTVKGSQRIDASQGGFVGTLGNDQTFGNALTTLGDLDGDGITEIAVGAQYDTDSSSGFPLTWVGAAWIFFLNADGTLKAQQKISDAAGGMVGHLRENDRFARSIEAVGDVDGDGVPDLAVGAPLDGTVGGAVYLLFLNSDGTVRTHRIIGRWLGNFAPDWPNTALFGTSITSLGDVDGNGHVDLAVGSPVETSGFPPGGQVYQLLLRHGPWLDVGNGLAGSVGLPKLDVGGTPATGELVTVTAHDLPDIDVAHLVIGASSINAPFKGGIYVPSPDLTLPLFPFGGFEHLVFTWPSINLSGATLWMQAWFQDSSTPAGWAASNGVMVSVP